MTESEAFAALFFAGLICVGLLGLAGITAFLEATPERRAWADRLAERVFGR